jgi:Lrp/AsnC family leucine-responsive transcriptional regulator
MDEKDKKILELLQRDGRMTNADLAKALNLTPSATLERVKKLEEGGLIRGYMALVNPKALDLGLLAFIFVQVDCKDEESAARELESLPCVQELHHLAGEDCYLVKVRARDTEDLYRILTSDFWRSLKIQSTRTTIVLSTSKETPILPIP